MRVIITGGTGLIGGALCAALLRHGLEVIILSRTPAPHQTPPDARVALRRVVWDGRSAAGWGALITRDTAIVNLAGANPAHWRWTPDYRRLILQSRLDAGSAVTEACRLHGPPARLIQASASGFYGDRGEEILTETSAAGHGFRATVCQQWEASTASLAVSRCVIRTGIVLAFAAGAYPPLRRFAQLLGRRIGSGKQWLPWVHLTDVAGAICWLLEHHEIVGPVNVCAPASVSNGEFIDAVGHMLGRPGIVPLPAPLLRLALGEMSSAVLDSERMLPTRLLAADFAFAHPHLTSALADLHARR